jgi:hypothetical protein
MARVKLTEQELALVNAFRAERNIYNSALADALIVIKEAVFTEVSDYNACVAAILKLRKEG